MEDDLIEELFEVLAESLIRYTKNKLNGIEDLSTLEADLERFKRILRGLQ